MPEIIDMLGASGLMSTIPYTTGGGLMKLRLIRIGLVLAGHAIGLWITSLILADDMSVSGAAFVIAVVIFTVLMLVLDPLVERLAEKYADFLTGGGALVSTALALLLTDWISDGLSMDGIGTWILATVLVWIVTAIVGVLFARFVLKRFVTERPSRTRVSVIRLSAPGARRRPDRPPVARESGSLATSRPARVGPVTAVDPRWEM